MYKIYADDTLIYDSTIEDYKIGKGVVTLETNKSGSFVFSLYPDHFYYDKFVRLKTVIKVLRDGKIVFRGRILNDVTDYFNNKVITCEGELGFLQDSIIRPYDFSGTPEALFKKFITEYNDQVDDFKKFKIGTVTVVDPNDKIVRSNASYENALSNLNSRLLDGSLGGYFYITHGSDGSEEIPTLNYLANFEKVSTQKIEFGSNLKDYTKKVTAGEIATAIIPLGAEIDDGDEKTPNLKLTIDKVNGGKDYVYDQTAVSLYGWIYKVVEWDDVTLPENLKAKALKKLENIIKQNVTIELNAIDLHLLDKKIESFNVCEYVRVISEPHKFDSVLLCNKQTLDLLKPDNDSLVLGYTYSTFTENSNKVSTVISSVSSIQATVNKVSNSVIKAQEDANKALNDYGSISKDMGTLSGDIQGVAKAVVDNAKNIAINAGNISKNSKDIDTLKQSGGSTVIDISDIKRDMQTVKTNIKDLQTDVVKATEDLSYLSKDLSDNKTKLDNAITFLGVAQTDIDNLETNLETVTTDLTTVKSEIKTIKETITTVNSTLETTTTDITNIKESINTTNETLKNITSGMNTLTESLGNTDKTIGVLQNEIKTSLIDPLTIKKTSIEDIITRLEALEKPVDPTPPPKTLTSITAMYSGGDVEVGTDVTTLTGVEVTAHYSDESTEIVTEFTLSGTIVKGENKITVTYQDQTTEIIVNGIDPVPGHPIVEPEVPGGDTSTEGGGKTK